MVLVVSPALVEQYCKHFHCDFPTLVNSFFSIPNPKKQNFFSNLQYHSLVKFSTRVSQTTWFFAYSEMCLDYGLNGLSKKLPKNLKLIKPVLKFTHRAINFLSIHCKQARPMISPYKCVPVLCDKLCWWLVHRTFSDRTGLHAAPRTDVKACLVVCLV